MTVAFKTDGREPKAHDPAPRLTTPAGLQANAIITRRRLAVALAVVTLWAALMFAAVRVAAAGGISALDALMLALFAAGTPWAVLGFVNAAAGVWLLHGRPGGLAQIMPFNVPDGEKLHVKTAVLMTLRNEDPARALARLKTVKASLDATGQGGQFGYFVLSDSSHPAIAQQEEAEVARWRAEAGDGARITYRRRTSNAGFKAGNVRDFCMTMAQGYDLMLPLDADSLMTGEAVVRLAGLMQAHPKLGILQSLVVGMPSSSPFARIFQFGMRFGMRSYTAGQAWWTADCGPFWGHNALVRIAPFVAHCDLPLLAGAPPLGGPILSHDQVEAVLMRRAGYEVRVMPVEGGSYEENPPDALAFIHRDVRWCQGNMQYVKLLGLRGIEPVSRFQLVWAILMFLGTPVWTLLIALSPLAVWQAQAIPDFPVAGAQALYLTFLAMSLTPKIAGLTDAVLTRGEVARFGGPVRFFASAALELVFSFLQGAVSAIRTSLFMAGLLFGKSITWSGQKRDAAGITWRQAASVLWPQMLFGVCVCGALYAVSPAALAWSLPLTAGYVLAIPFAVVTANPALGRYMRRHGLAGIPEDFAPPAEIAAIGHQGAQSA